MKRELSLVVDGVQMTVTVERAGDRIVVTRDGERHEVVVTSDRFVVPGGDDSPPRPRAATPGASPGSAPRDRATHAATAGVGTGDVRAPMVGVVREIHVAQGNTVESGDRVITMEAMKMDIYVNAPVDGSVASILCSVGETATEGAVLATIAPAEGHEGST